MNVFGLKEVVTPQQHLTSPQTLKANSQIFIIEGASRRNYQLRNF